jgi:hypothetical protein
MHSMQYTFTFPEEFDMNAIRQRVAEKGRAFDALPELAIKAFLITDRSGGADANRYAPFYIWQSKQGLQDFLFGDRFGAVSAAFGRPAVAITQLLNFDIADRSAAPAFATQETISLAKRDLLTLRATETERHVNALATPGLFARAVAVDTERWNLHRFSFWTKQESFAQLGEKALLYQVLHLSAPLLQRHPYA